MIGIPTALIGSAVLQTGASVYNTASQNRANRELAQYAYQKDLEMWNKSNEYNTPLAQRQRLVAAGLNPNLVYGNGVTGNASSALPKYQAPKMEYDIRPPDIAALLQTYNDVAIKKQTVNNMKAQEDNTRASIVTEGLKQANLTTSTARSQFDLELAQELRKTSLEAAKANLELTTAQTVRNLKDATLADYDISDRQQGIRPQDPFWLRHINQQGLSGLKKLFDLTNKMQRNPLLMPTLSNDRTNLKNYFK